jgi:hypothetical protein
MAHLRMSLLRRILLLAALAALAAVFTASSALAAIPNPYHYDTDWRQLDNGCLARAEVNYWSSSNRLEMRTSVRSPWLFAGCRVNAHPVFYGTFGPIDDGPTQFAAACAVWDPTCPSQRTTPWAIFDPASSTLAFLKGYLNADLSQILNFVDVRLTPA